MVNVSLILDALKKSERERQRDKAPGLQSIHVPLPHRGKKSRWPIGLAAAVILVNAAALAYWRLQQPTASPPSATAAIKPLVAPTATSGRVPADAGESANMTKPPAPEFARIAPEQAPAAQMPAESNLRIEEVGELPDAVRNELPAMTFSFHVYSANPQQRTIIINNKRMREGDEVSQGLQLQEITDDGVVLLFRQHRIHINVLSGW